MRLKSSKHESQIKVTDSFSLFGLKTNYNRSHVRIPAFVAHEKDPGARPLTPSEPRWFIWLFTKAKMRKVRWPGLSCDPTCDPVWTMAHDWPRDPACAMACDPTCDPVWAMACDPAWTMTCDPALHRVVHRSHNPHKWVNVNISSAAPRRFRSVITPTNGLNTKSWSTCML